MSGSFLSRDLSKNAKLLEKGAQKHLDDVLHFENLVKDISPNLLGWFLTKNKINIDSLLNWSRDYFSSNKLYFTAIDGTMIKTTVMDANIFFAGSYESSGIIFLDQNNKMGLEYQHTYSSKGRGLTSVLPLQVSEVIEVDTQFDLDVLRSDAGVQIREDVLLDQSNIAESLMLLSEYYLAYKTLVEKPDSTPHIILFDRSIAGDHSSLIARTQKQVLWTKTVNLIGYTLKNDDLPFDENEFFWARWYTAEFFDPIRPYLKFKILNKLSSLAKPLTQNELSDHLALPRNLRNDLISELKLLERKGLIVRLEKKFSLNPRYNNSWSRIKQLVLEMGQRFFQTEADNLDTKSPFLIKKYSSDGGVIEKWITTRDLAFLTLFLQYMVIEWLWSNKGLVLGLTKDSAARDFRRQLLPIAYNQGWVDNIPSTLPLLPHSDRAFLQQISGNNPSMIPWMLQEYDAVFRTITEDGKDVIGAKSNLSGVMKLFSKSYVQLKKSNQNPDLQSHVLAMDRILTKEELLNKLDVHTLDFKKSDKNPITFPLQVFFSQFTDSKSSEPSLQQFILVMLEAMTPHSIPEAFGHNKPLFIADKVAKFYLQEFKRLLTSMGHWITINPSLRKDKLKKEKFRDNRQTIELNRKLT